MAEIKTGSITDEQALTRLAVDSPPVPEPEPEEPEPESDE